MRLSFLEKVLFIEVQTWQVFDRFLGGDKLISEYFDSKFQ